MSTATYASTCTLTVSKSTLEKDLLLQLVTKIASPLQLETIIVASTKKQEKLELAWSDGVMRQRNAIVRALCGYCLHFALDQAPFYLLGGHGATANASQSSSLALGAATTWMSVASNLCDNHNDNDFWQGLDEHLRDYSFLVVPSPVPTVADFDMALAILSREDIVDSIASYDNIKRWLKTAVYFMQLYAGQDGPKIPDYVDGKSAAVVPVFYYGIEDPASVFKSNTKKPVPSTQGRGNAVNKKDNNDKAKSAKGNADDKASKKKDKQAAPKKSTPAPTTTTEEDYNISALDIRVGRITKVWEHKEAEKLFCEEIDLGNGEVRSIASGLRPFYKLEDLQDRLVVVLYNLKKRNLVGFPSHGMVLCASNADHTSVEFVEPPADTPLGERVVFESFEDGQAETENKLAKKKVFEKLAPDLKTDGSGNVVWKGKVGKTSKGVLKASKGMPNAQVS